MKKTTLKALSTEEITAIHKAVSNPKRLDMLVWLKSAGYGIFSSFVRKLGLKRSFVSKSIKTLMAANLINMELMVKNKVYSVNQELLKYWSTE